MQKNAITDEMASVGEEWRTELEALVNGDWPELDDEIRCLAEEPVPAGMEPDRWDYLSRYPLVGAAIIKYSAFYHSEYGAANTLWSYAHRQSNACEWHIHMASMSKKSLREVNDEVVVAAVRFAQSGRSLYGAGDDPSFNKALERVRDALNRPAP